MIRFLRALRAALFGPPAPRFTVRHLSSREYLESRAVGRTMVRIEKSNG